MLVKYWRNLVMFVKNRICSAKNTYQTASFFYPLILYQSIPLFSIHLNLCNPPFNCSTVGEYTFCTIIFVVWTLPMCLEITGKNVYSVQKFCFRTFLSEICVGTFCPWKFCSQGYFASPSYWCLDVMYFRAFYALVSMSGCFFDLTFWGFGVLWSRTLCVFTLFGKRSIDSSKHTLQYTWIVLLYDNIICRRHRMTLKGQF